MINSVKRIFITLSLLISCSVMSHVGGIVCYEGERLRLPIVLPAMLNLPENEILENIFISIERMDPVKAQMYRTRWEKILGWTTVRGDFKLRLNEPGPRQDNCEGTYLVTKRNQIWLSRDALVKLSPVERALIYLELIISHEKYEFKIETPMRPELILHYLQGDQLSVDEWLKKYVTISKGSDEYFNFFGHFITTSGVTFGKESFNANISNLNVTRRIGYGDVNLRGTRATIRYSGSLAALQFSAETEISVREGILRSDYLTLTEDEQIKCVTLSGYSILKDFTGKIRLVNAGNELCFENGVWSGQVNIR